MVYNAVECCNTAAVYDEISKASLELGISDTEEIINLKHIILSHHGQLEYGSPKEPATPEAALIHFLDYNDSRLAALENEIKKTDFHQSFFV